MSGTPAPDGPDAVEMVVPLTARQRDRLIAYVDLLRRWQPVKNLVAPATLAEVWRRHVADSAQAHAVFPAAVRWADLGSGAGLPGLVTAVLVAERPGAMVHLVESNGRKAAFLRTVTRELGLPVTIYNERIESYAKREASDVEAVSARALAALDTLLALAAPLLIGGAAGIFHKGREFGTELAKATLSWAFDLVEHHSLTEDGGRLVVIRGLKPR